MAKLRRTTQQALVTAVYAVYRHCTDGKNDKAGQKKWLAVWHLIEEAVKQADVDINTSDETAAFDGAYYNPFYDKDRLGTQLARIFTLMRDGAWRTLAEISDITGAPAASVSAQLRNLRKPRHGSWMIDKVPVGAREQGLNTYRMRNPDGSALPPLRPMPRPKRRIP